VVDKIKVLIVDDSELVCNIFAKELNKDPELEVVGTAPDPIIARDLINKLRPDVLLLDIEMPKMDGLTFLEQLMEYFPMPVIIVSSIAQEGSAAALRATELGAAEVIAKPGPSYSVKEMTEQLIEKVKAVVEIKTVKHSNLSETSRSLLIKDMRLLQNSGKIIALGASTGGIEAITSILSKLPAEMPPILVVQHMPLHFTKIFAERLNSICALEVKEAEDKEPLIPGKVLLAPGNKHMVLKKNQYGYYVEVKAGPLVLHQRPSIEVLFRSIALYAGKGAIGVLLTGAGKDGAEGLLDMKNAGALTIAQDEASSLVYGIPKEAVAIGAVSRVVPLDEIPQVLISSLEEMR
jgi:two-component system chemotaxis response regulator CheB